MFLKNLLHSTYISVKEQKDPPCHFSMEFMDEIKFPSRSDFLILNQKIF